MRKYGGLFIPGLASFIFELFKFQSHLTNRLYVPTFLLTGEKVYNIFILLQFINTRTTDDL